MENEIWSNVNQQLIFSSILLLIVSMNFGFLLFMPSSKGYSFINRSNIIGDINNKRLWLILIIVFFILSFFFRRVASYVFSGDLLAIRQMIYNTEFGSEGSLYNSGIETVIVQWVANSLIMAIFIIVIVSFLIGKSSFRLLSFSFFMGVYFAALTGGRMMLFKFLIIIMAAVILLKWKDIKLFVNEKYLRSVKKRKGKLGLIICLIFVLGLWITIARSDSESSVLNSEVYETIWYYLYFPVLYFAQLLENQDFSSGPLLGGAFLGGLTQAFNIVWGNLTGSEILVPYEIIVEETAVFLNVGGQLYNAFPTMLYAFYRDAGLIGIVINAILFSIYISFSYLYYLKRNNLRSIALYILSFYLIVMGILRWEPSFIQYWLTLLFIFLLTGSKNTKEINKSGSAR